MNLQTILQDKQNPTDLLTYNETQSAAAETTPAVGLASQRHRMSGGEPPICCLSSTVCYVLDKWLGTVHTTLVRGFQLVNLTPSLHFALFFQTQHITHDCKTSCSLTCLVNLQVRPASESRLLTDADHTCAVI